MRIGRGIEPVSVVGAVGRSFHAATAIATARAAA
ncbi:Uncharacterised protein [Mycobacteroides abscessus subsp. abscessus]|nr:Uncharacterised protein [Mycobacteroides abscessus subsp. abscessus]